MANGKGLIFLAGAFIGATISYLAFTEKGKEIREDIRYRRQEWWEDGRACFLNHLDRLKDDDCEE